MEPRSREWHCPDCQQTNLECLPDPPATGADELKTDETTDVGPVKSESEQDIVATPAILVSESSPEPAANPTPTPTTSAPPATVVSAPQPVPGISPTPTTPTFSTRPTPASHPPARPPILLDLAIISLVSIFIAILARRVL